MPYRRGDPLIHNHFLFLAASRTLLHLVAILGWPLVRLLYRYRVHGRDNLAAAAKRRQPIIFVANHSIPLDSLLHGIAIQPRLSWFTIIEETVMTPILGNLVRLLRGIPIPTDTERLSDIDAAMATALRPRGASFSTPKANASSETKRSSPSSSGPSTMPSRKEPSSSPSYRC